LWRPASADSHLRARPARPRRPAPWPPHHRGGDGHHRGAGGLARHHPRAPQHRHRTRGRVMMTTPHPNPTEIIRNALISFAQDINATLIRSAYTPIIYEGKDCAVALLDSEANVLGQSLGVPLFLGNLEACVKLTAERLGWEAFQPGDVFHMNDSYMTGTHLNDATIFAPVHWQDRLLSLPGPTAPRLHVRAQGPPRPQGSHEIFPAGGPLAPPPN